MSNQTSAMTHLLRGLFDDASLFPPGDLPMPAAVAGHVRHRAAWYGDMAGPFVCPETRIAELRRVLTAAVVPEIDLSVVVTGGAQALESAVESVAADPRLRLRAIEVPVRRDAEPEQAVAELVAALDQTLLAGAAGYIEIPLASLADDTAAGDLLGPIGGHGYRPKLRTGGVTAAAFPDEGALAAGLLAVTSRRLEFKCTAGLHHAVRQAAADTGFEHHGFLNVLLAVAAALDGADLDEVAAVLADTDSGQVAGRLSALEEDQARMVRSFFASFGTCSTDEPVADLVALGLVSPAPAAS
jgi:hypothetical protein